MSTAANDRASRRKQRERAKARAKKFLSLTHIKPSDEGYARQLGIRAKTPKACGCWMCTNPRRQGKDCQTQQEKRAALVERDGRLSQE